MTKEMTIVEARSRLTQLSDELENDPEFSSIAITRHGKPIMALMNFELYESIVETLEIMGDAGLTEALRASVAEAARGEVIPWDEAKKQLDL